MRTTLYRRLMLDNAHEYERLIAELGAYAHEGIARCNRGQALAEIGRVDEALERYDEALADYSATLALAPDEVTYWRTRADLLHRLGRFDDAIADYDVAVRLDPEFQYTLDARERARNRQPCDEDDVVVEVE